MIKTETGHLLEQSRCPDGVNLPSQIHWKNNFSITNFTLADRRPKCASRMRRF